MFLKGPAGIYISRIAAEKASPEGCQRGPFSRWSDSFGPVTISGRVNRMELPAPSRSPQAGPSTEQLGGRGGTKEVAVDER